MYTIDCAKTWVTENLEGIMEAYETSPSIPSFLRSSKLEEVWKAGCFLRDKLLENGATESQAEEIGFVMGQRSMSGNPWEWAVKYLNEFVLNKKIEDVPGYEFASEIIEEELND